MFGGDEQRQPQRRQTGHLQQCEFSGLTDKPRTQQGHHQHHRPSQHQNREQQCDLRIRPAARRERVLANVGGRPHVVARQQVAGDACRDLVRLRRVMQSKTDRPSRLADWADSLEQRTADEDSARGPFRIVGQHGGRRRAHHPHRAGPPAGEHDLVADLDAEHVGQRGLDDDLIIGGEPSTGGQRRAVHRHRFAVGHA